MCVEIPLLYKKVTNNAASVIEMSCDLFTFSASNAKIIAYKTKEK